MRLTLPYHRSSLDLDLQNRKRLRVTGSRFPTSIANLGAELLRAVAKPVSSEPLHALVPGSGRISILIADVTRGGHAAVLLRPLLEFLESSGADPGRVEIVCASGMHRGHSREELESHLGTAVLSRWKVSEHIASEEGSLVEAGTTSSGNRCRFSRRVVESSLVIGIGSVSYHYFAGFGGGRKLILPGVAGESTILANHRLSLMEDPARGLSAGCRPGNLEGNPVHEDMAEGARLLPAPVFFINCVPGDKGGIAFLNAGDMVESHFEACRFLSGHFSIPLEKRFQAVIVSAGGYPKDINLLQSHKALRYASYALREGGIMLAAAACPEGIGSPSYRNAFRRGREGVPDSVRERYTLNAQTAMSTWDLTGRFTIHLGSMLEESELSMFGFRPWRVGETAGLLDGIGDEEILVIVNGSTFLPASSER